MSVTKSSSVNGFCSRGGINSGDEIRFSTGDCERIWGVVWCLILGGLLVMGLVGCGELDSYSRPQVRPDRYGVVTNPEDLARPAEAASSGSSPMTPAAPTSSSPAPSPPPTEISRPAPPSEASAPYSPPLQPPTPRPGYVRERAGLGATGKGDYRPGILTTPLSVYFRAQERIVFESQIPHAMRLYHATNGRYPASWEEFEREILVPNGIRLPQLPPGHKYHYDPQTGQLMIEKPAP